MTSTRAAMSGLMLAVAIMAIASARRRAIIAAFVGIMVFIPLGAAALERTRGLSIFNPSDGSTAYRLEVWREALGLIKTHPLVGIGKGSEGAMKESFGLFGNGRLPPGHFHSTIIQIPAWWGLPALAFYFSFMTIFFVKTWQLCKKAQAQGRRDVWGLALGALGALVAFNVSSLVHFNFGDGEVVMTFWFLTGLVFAARRLIEKPAGDGTPEQVRAIGEEESSNKNLPRAQEAASESSARAAKARQG
jgi:O-antigen ligase